MSEVRVCDECGLTRYATSAGAPTQRTIEAVVGDRVVDAWERVLCWPCYREAKADARKEPEDSAPAKYHVRCTHVSCRWHVTARGKETAEKVAAGHERTSDHDVDVVEDRIVSFSRTSASDPFPDPPSADD